jgi:hypothetical protein
LYMQEKAGETILSSDFKVVNYLVGIRC